MPTDTLESLKDVIPQKHQSMIIGRRGPPAHMELQGINPLNSIFWQAMLWYGPKET